MFRCPKCKEEFDANKKLIAHLKANRECETAAVMEIIKSTSSDMAMLEELFGVK